MIPIIFESIIQNEMTKLVKTFCGIVNIYVFFSNPKWFEDKRNEQSMCKTFKIASKILQKFIEPPIKYRWLFYDSTDLWV